MKSAKLRVSRWEVENQNTSNEEMKARLSIIHRHTNTFSAKIRATLLLMLFAINITRPEIFVVFAWAVLLSHSLSRRQEWEENYDDTECSKVRCAKRRAAFRLMMFPPCSIHISTRKLSQDKRNKSESVKELNVVTWLERGDRGCRHVELESGWGAFAVGSAPCTQACTS